MARALRIALFVFGAVLVVEGLLDIAAPEQRAKMMGLADAAGPAPLPLMILGATWLAAGLCVMASARDPQRHLDGLRFAITLAALLFAVLAYSSLRGYIEFRQVSVDLLFDGLFAGIFVALYPRRRSS